MFTTPNTVGRRRSWLNSCSRFRPAAYDVAMGYSLFTDLEPTDTAYLLRLTHDLVRLSGYLFFTAFCDDRSRPLKTEYRIPIIKGLLQP
jgi:hypothetical protein